MEVMRNVGRVGEGEVGMGWLKTCTEDVTSFSCLVDVQSLSTFNMRADGLTSCSPS